MKALEQQAEQASAMLSQEVIDHFNRHEAHQAFEPGDVICEEGDPGGLMYVILAGETVVSVQGRAIDHLTAGSIFGEMALVDDRPRSATVTAATSGKLVPVDRDRFAALVRQLPDFAVQVMSVMSERLRRLMEEEIERLRLAEEMKIGHEIQLSFLPDRCPEYPGWEFAATYRSAKLVGGDLYDFISSPEEPGLLHIVIADVTGKGVPAALFMASSRTTIRAESMNGRRPAETLRRTNRSISLNAHAKLFLSAFYATLETDTGLLTFANGGHELPLWLRAGTGELDSLAARGLVLGAFDDVPYEEGEVFVANGDFIVFYTDGITEARDASGHFFGDERLHQVMLSQSWDHASRLLEAIVGALDQFVGATPPSDDLTLVVMKRQ